MSKNAYTTLFWLFAGAVITSVTLHYFTNWLFWTPFFIELAATLLIWIPLRFGEYPIVFLLVVGGLNPISVLVLIIILIVMWRALRSFDTDIRTT